jgi:hypothetical protein
MPPHSIVQCVRYMAMAAPDLSTAGGPWGALPLVRYT